jgi:hypothetical protein
MKHKAVLRLALSPVEESWSWDGQAIPNTFAIAVSFDRGLAEVCCMLHFDVSLL